MKNSVAQRYISEVSEKSGYERGKSEVFETLKSIFAI